MIRHPASGVALAAALLLVPLAGCRHGPKPGPGPSGAAAVTPEPPAAPADAFVGVIDRLGAEAKFVVILLEPGQQAKEGDELIVRFAGVDVGKVKVSPERKGRFITADVVSGTVEKGYEVVRRPGAR